MKAEIQNSKAESKLDVTNDIEGAVSGFGFRALWFMRSGRVRWGGGLLVLVIGLCVVSMVWTLRETSPLYYDTIFPFDGVVQPSWGRPPMSSQLALWFGTDALGRSLLGRCLLGGVVSLSVGVAAALISVVLGVSVGLLAGYRGGWVDGLLMRSVDVLYGLPYILLVILFKIAFQDPLEGVLRRMFGEGSGWVDAKQASNFIVLFLAIGLVSWLTMARVVRGQVLLLRSLPFIEAARASGLTEWRIFGRHLLPNLAGPIIVYATLIVPQAILQESFLSFLGIGITPPLPSWGLLASENLISALNPVHPRWWLLAFPCTMLALTLLSLNFLGDGLRDVFDPKREAAKI